jgi:FMN phosphatase YigB (HAD superfamily)
MRMTIRAVLFDVGETLVDETRMWSAWAQWLDVPPRLLWAALGAVIARGEHHTRALSMVRPGFDLERERAARRAATAPERIDPDDLYPDVRAGLAALRAEGYRLGAAGNQPAGVSGAWSDGLDLDLVTSSAELGAEKPSPEFFSSLAGGIGEPPERCAYVGDRLDNDVAPAAEAGMLPILIRRGPWALIQDDADIRPAAAIDSLDELPRALRPWRDGPDR